MDVTFLPSTPWGNDTGGLYRAVDGLASALNSRKGVTARIVAVAKTADSSPAHEGNQVHLCKLLGPSRICYSKALATSLRRNAGDLVHVHGIWTYPVLAALQWHKNTGRPLVISTHGMLDAWAVQRSRLAKSMAAALFQRRAFANACCVHALNVSEADAIRRFGVRQPIAIIPNAVDIPATPHSPSQGVARAHRTFLFLGRMIQKKGIVELLQAWKVARHSWRQRNWRLVLAGWIASDFHNELTLLVDGLGIGESVALRGPVVGAEKLALMESSDAFVLPSHSEGQPLAVLEAWALGLPAVISAECNLPEGALAGAAVECRPNPQSIANSLAQVMAMSEAELAEMGLRGRKLVEREFSWRIVTQRFTSLYLWAIGGGQRPSWIRSI